MSGFELGMAMRQNLQCIPILNTKYMTDFNKFMPLPEEKKPTFNWLVLAMLAQKYELFTEYVSYYL